MNYSDLSTEQQMIAETKKYVNNKALDVQSDWNESDSSAGDYIKNKPTLGTAAVLDVASSGDASSSQVVKGDDSRLTDSRDAADVYSWAKAPTKPTYTASEVGAYTKTESDNKYVAKETGKGLSTNDYTTADKNKLAGIEAEANKTVVDSAMSDSSTNPLQNKVVTSNIKAINTNGAKNLLPMTLANIKAYNISGTWSGNAYTYNGVTFTVNTDNNGNVIGIATSGTAGTSGTGYVFFKLATFTNNGISCILSGCPLNGNKTTYSMFIQFTQVNFDTGSGVNFDDVGNGDIMIRITSGVDVTGKTFYPMIRLASDTDPTFQPYAKTNLELTNALQGSKTATGNPITIEDAAPVNAVNLSMDLEPIQAGSGTPSPDNIRPISGRSEVAIKRVGKNLFDKGTVTDGYRFGSDGIPFAQSGYSVSDYIRVDKSTAYVRDKNMNTNECACLYDSNKGFIDRITTGKTFQTTSATCYVRLSMLTTDKDTTQFEKGSTATTFEPYAGKTYTIQLGQDVYGGQLDVTRGKMVVDNGYAEFDGSSDESLSYTDNTLVITNISPLEKSGTLPISNQYKSQAVTSWTELKDFSFSFHPSNGNTLRVKDSRNTSLADWKTYLSNNPLQVVYELATPFTIDLTPQQIKLLENTNTVYTDYDGDTITIEYQPNNAIGEAVRVVEENYETRVSLLESRNTAKVYGFHISSTESDPAAKVTYLADAVGMTPAKMNFSTGKFDYGSWGNVWFVRDTKPCHLLGDGTVRLYLDKNDFSKDVDGNYAMYLFANEHVMIEFPKIWYKVVPDLDGYGASVYIAPIKIDEDYVDYPYIDYLGRHKEHFYMSAYNNSVETIDGVVHMRSRSGEVVSKSLTASEEIDACKANGDGWYTEDAGSIMLINFLLILMGKSTDTQTVFGQGLHTGGTEAINNGFRPGIHDQKGMFYGTNSGTIASNSYGNAVKVFGIENYWGFQWRRYAGDILYGGHRKIKLCYGNDDGSATATYNLDGQNYVDIGETPSGTSRGYISKMKFTKSGMYSSVSSGSSSTYYCDGQWFNNSDTRYAFCGGSSSFGARCGAFCVYLADAASDAWWGVGVGLEYK